MNLLSIFAAEAAPALSSALSHTVTPAAVGIWTIVAIITPIAAVVAKNQLENRKLNINLRKLSMEEQVAMRSGFSEQVAQLSASLREARAEQDVYRNKCEAENGELRVEVAELKVELIEVRGKLTLASVRHDLLSAKLELYQKEDPR